ncbi:hypothetical protein E3E31_07125 [Thermococcus sp. M39]|uniref:hypothetical protein n=1 Tax=unclassified Thermococcus TaxID=2627626 RepID=UPI00143A9AD0|nr:MULTISPECIES: hypothetical protein [unclassified Thermococcus]NJE08294.1 hypothetical protein [Thermococcus sp. M39]NJE11787.1 hypothetical protein [Thermococcus sp. LS2]
MPAPMGGMGLGPLIGAIGFGMFVVMFIIGLAVAAVFLYIGAKFASIEDASFGKAIIAVVAGGILSLILSMIPVLGWILGSIAYIWIIKTVFNTDWVKAVIAWLISIIAGVVVMVILMAIVGISLLA